MTRVLKLLAHRNGPHAGRALPYAPGRVKMQSERATVITGRIDEGAMKAAFIISTPAEDRTGEVVLTRGCIPTLSTYQANPVVHLNHRTQEHPIALSETYHGEPGIDVFEDRIEAVAAFHGKTELSAQTWELTVLGVYKGASIGFRPLLAQREEIEATPEDYMAAPDDIVMGRKGYRLVFRRWELVEWSVTGVPCNQDAVISADYRDLVTRTLGRGTLDGGRKILPAIRADLSPFALRRKSWAVLEAKGDSYFAECPRDDEGHCLPSGESGSEGVGKKPSGAGGGKGKPAPSKARVSLGGGEAKKRADKFLEKHKLDSSTLASLVGAPDDATVTVSAHADGKTLELNVKSKKVQAIRFISTDSEGNLYIQNKEIEIKGTGTGLGSQIFANQVQWARELGVAYIKCDAAWGVGMNGYYTWPRLGYDAPLPDWFVKEAPEEFRGAETVLDLYAMPGGADWWKKEGRGLDARFDLSEGSRSLQVHEAYMEERARRSKSFRLAHKVKKAGKGEEIDLSEEEEAALEAVWEQIVKNGWEEKGWWPHPRKGDSYFSDCERDDAGHCLPSGEGGGGGGKEESGGGKETSEGGKKPGSYYDARDAHEAEVARLKEEHAAALEEHQDEVNAMQADYDEAHGEWQERQEERDNRRAELERNLEPDVDSADLFGPSSPGERVASGDLANPLSSDRGEWGAYSEAVDEWADSLAESFIHGYGKDSSSAALLADANATEGDLKRLHGAAEAGSKAVEKAVEKHRKALDKVIEYQERLNALEVVPDPGLEPDEPDEEEDPEGHAAWKKAQAQWEKDEAAFEKYEQKAEAMQSRLEELSDLEGEAYQAIEETWNDHETRYAEAEERVRDRVMERIDAEEAADEEPEEPDYPDPPEEPDYPDPPDPEDFDDEEEQ